MAGVLDSWEKSKAPHAGPRMGHPQADAFVPQTIRDTEDTPRNSGESGALQGQLREFLVKRPVSSVNRRDGQRLAHAFFRWLLESGQDGQERAAESAESATSRGKAQKAALEGICEDSASA